MLKLTTNQTLSSAKLKTWLPCYRDHTDDNLKWCIMIELGAESRIILRLPWTNVPHCTLGPLIFCTQGGGGIVGIDCLQGILAERAE